MFELPIEKPRLAEEKVPEERISRILDRHNGARGSLIATLEEIQTECGYLPEESLRLVAEKTGRSLVDIYGVATFYNLFNLKPRGKHLVSACLGTACHVRGSHAIVDEFEKQLGIEVGETTPDRRFTLKTVNCLGACALGPVAVIDGRYFSKIRTSSVRSLIEGTTNGHASGVEDEDGRVFPVDASCPSCNHSLMDEGFLIEEHPAVRVTVSFEDKHGWLRLSSIYGHYEVFSEYDIPFDTVVNFFCPHCHAELIGSWKCARCEAPMVQMIVRGGGTVRICSRRGCNGSESHMLDLA